MSRNLLWYDDEDMEWTTTAQMLEKVSRQPNKNMKFMFMATPYGSVLDIRYVESHLYFSFNVVDCAEGDETLIQEEIANHSGMFAVLSEKCDIHHMLDTVDSGDDAAIDSSSTVECTEAPRKKKGRNGADMVFDLFWSPSSLRSERHLNAKRATRNE